jgi:hypothetical protein
MTLSDLSGASTGLPAAIDGERFAGDETRLVRTKEQDGCGYLRWLAQPADRMKRGEPGAVLLLGADQSVDHLGYDGPGSDGVHANPFVGILQRNRLGQADPKGSCLES